MREARRGLGAPVRQAAGHQPVVVVVDLVAAFLAQRAESLRTEVLAQAHRLEAVLCVHGREVHLSDQRGFVSGPLELVRDGPEALAKREAGSPGSGPDAAGDR